MIEYNIFRWYRAGWGRYTQPDPADVPLLTDDYAPVDTLLRGHG